MKKKNKMAASEKVRSGSDSSISRVLHGNFEDDLGDDDLFGFLDFQKRSKKR